MHVPRVFKLYGAGILASIVFALGRLKKIRTALSKQKGTNLHRWQQNLSNWFTKLKM
jgi:hypothetical protein